MGRLSRMLCCMQVGEDELAAALEASVTCCILAAAGPQRSRVLANLYKDARVSRLKVFPFLEKVYLERILRPHEVHPCCLVQCNACNADLFQPCSSHVRPVNTTPRCRQLVTQLAAACACSSMAGWLHDMHGPCICWPRQMHGPSALDCSRVTMRLEQIFAGMPSHSMSISAALHGHVSEGCKPATARISQVAAFSDMLRPHQRAKTADGTTVLEKAVIEHNLAAAAKLYLNIATAELGALLGTSTSRAEEIAARMVSEGRLMVRQKGMLVQDESMRRKAYAWNMLSIHPALLL